MQSVNHDQNDGAFFARLGVAFAVSIVISGFMMFAVGPVSQTDRDDVSQIAALTSDLKR